MKRWKILDPWGLEPDLFENCTWPTKQLAQEECDWLHEHEDLDIYDGFGVYSPYYRPVVVGAELKFNSFGILEYPQE